VDYSPNFVPVIACNSEAQDAARSGIEFASEFFDEKSAINLGEPIWGTEHFRQFARRADQFNPASLSGQAPQRAVAGEDEQTGRVRLIVGDLSPIQVTGNCSYCSFQYLRSIAGVV
jgi:hypothetical protein